MAMINQLWFAALTRNKTDAGSQDLLNLTVNIGGTDIVDANIAWHLEQGEAYFLWNSDFAPFETNQLTDSSIRLGIRGDDLWLPEHIFFFGRSPRTVVPLTIETDLDTGLSTDSSEGHLTMP